MLQDFKNTFGLNIVIRIRKVVSNCTETEDLGFSGRLSIHLLCELKEKLQGYSVRSKFL